MTGEDNVQNSLHYEGITARLLHDRPDILYGLGSNIVRVCRAICPAGPQDCGADVVIQAATDKVNFQYLCQLQSECAEPGVYTKAAELTDRKIPAIRRNMASRYN